MEVIKKGMDPLLPFSSVPDLFPFLSFLPYLRATNSVRGVSPNPVRPGIVPTGRAGRKPRTSRNRFDTEPEIKSFGDKKLTNRLQAAKAAMDNKIRSHETGSSDPAGSDVDTTVVTLADKASVRKACHSLDLLV